MWGLCLLNVLVVHQVLMYPVEGSVLLSLLDVLRCVSYPLLVTIFVPHLMPVILESVRLALKCALYLCLVVISALQFVILSQFVFHRYIFISSVFMLLLCCTSRTHPQLLGRK